MQRNDAGAVAASSSDSPYNRRITGTTPMRDDRSGGRQRPAEDERRPDRHAGARHAQQLRRRHDPVGHGADRRGELPAVLRQPGRACPKTIRFGRCTIATVSARGRRSGAGRSSTPASTWRRSRTSRSASAGSSRSTPTTRPRRRRSAPRSAASSTRAPRRRSRRAARSPSTRGDDERFDYAYKFVTSGTYNPDDRAANVDLLDEGTLYVAKFNDDGTGEWLPLVHGEGPLTEANGFASQGDVLIKTRLAADALGATKMDRPEDFETNPVTGKVYLVCTNNNQRTLEQDRSRQPAAPTTSPATSSRSREDGDDHAATTFTWEIFILAGDPDGQRHLLRRLCERRRQPVRRAGQPDLRRRRQHLDLDRRHAEQPPRQRRPLRRSRPRARSAAARCSSSAPFPGAECSGPVFNPDNTALWVSVQHPGEGGTLEEPRQPLAGRRRCAAAIGRPDHGRRSHDAYRTGELAADESHQRGCAVSPEDVSGLPCSLDSTTARRVLSRAVASSSTA